MSVNYKKFIKDQETRIKVLQMLDFIPDTAMLKLQYLIKTGNRLNLKNPMRYTEKLQWYKLFYRNDLMPVCVDKYEVRSYVQKMGCGNLLNECYGVYDTPDEIVPEMLPERYVLKDTLGSGGSAVRIVEGRDGLKKIKQELLSWVSFPTNKKDPGREWPYEKRKHRIVAEKYLVGPNGDLADYKFFCFDGLVNYFYVRTGYSGNHAAGRMAFFDRNLQYLKGVGMDYCAIFDSEPELPKNIEEMIMYAEKLAKPFPHVRVDFYNIQGTVIFGELTFFNASGYMKFTPDQFDFTMGERFYLPGINKF